MPSDNRSRYGPSTTGKPKSTISKASSSASSYYPAGSSVYQQSGKDSYSTIGSEVSRSTARSGAGGSAVSSDHRDISQRMQQANFDDDVRSTYPERDPARPQASRGYEDDETLVATLQQRRLFLPDPRAQSDRSAHSDRGAHRAMMPVRRCHADQGALGAARASRTMAAQSPRRPPCSRPDRSAPRDRESRNLTTRTQ